MGRLPAIDLAVLVGYLAVIVGVGAWFALRRRTADDYMAAGRSLPGWAVGVSIFGSYVSSISFLANPGKAFATNWNSFVFSLATPVAAVIAAAWLVPFYRRRGELSAYEHLEQRFGAWARTYAVVCFLLVQTARMATILYLLSLPVSAMTGLRSAVVVVATGALMTTYTLLGGMRAVVWTGVLQGAVLLLGPVVCVAALLAQTPGGLGAVVRVGAEHGKFGLGGFDGSPGAATFWVTLVYGLVINLGNFAIDQSYVQRYHTARSEGEARRSVLLAASLYVPTSAVFFFIVTALFAFYSTRPELLTPGIKPDGVFPLFISRQLPAGLAGLVVAGIFAAAMDSNLNSMATLTLCDIYRRYARPRAGDRESLSVLYVSTLAWGAAGILGGLALTKAKTVLDVWWDLAGVLSGGTLGLFLIGAISRRVGSAAAACGVVAGVLVIVWVSLSAKSYWPAGWPRSRLHEWMAVVIGTATIVVVGLLAGAVLGRRRG